MDDLRDVTDLPNVITDVTGRRIDVFMGQVGDDPVALIEVRSRSEERPVVSLWMCADQIDKLTTAAHRAWRDSAREVWTGA